MIMQIKFIDKSHRAEIGGQTVREIKYAIQIGER